ncbi:hypothetical protein M0534_02095 [Methylonatrum kenyense]|uniref:hypothetical protein n=1 Tax=Methylonatrum kenyense TaxID=455253 RepID=UPI0020BF7A52|nr:hypothetical protein [Methylonatrum kenyense]MCK8515125.1 hypothetical protein [Methylonatrum kenyense]
MNQPEQRTATLRSLPAPAMCLSRAEIWLLQRFGDHLGAHRKVPRLIPLLLVLSPVVWFVAPERWGVVLTPWVGAIALLLAGLYLGRVVIATGRACLEHAARDETLDAARVRELRKGLLGALSVILCTLVLGVVFLLAAKRVLVGGNAEVAALLWALCLGGLFLSLFVGELVMRLIDVISDDMGP